MSRFFSLNPSNRAIFDLLILDDVIGWMDPKNIPQVFAVLDWLLKEGGHILIRELDSDFPFRVKNHHHPDREIYNYRYARGFSSFFLATGLYRKRAESVSHDPSLQRIESSSSFSNWKDCLITKVSESMFPTVQL